MARLRQQNASNYVSSGNINAEFENVVRYINAAELGNKTLSELLSTIFDEDGEFDGPIEFRLDSTDGLQWRVGEYDSESEGWQTLAEIADLRGPSGADIGDIGAPIFHSRQDSTATAGQTVFSYAHDADDDLLIFDNGVLMTPTVDYNSDAATDTVTFTSGRVLNNVITFFRVRANAVTGYTRTDTVTAAPQAVFPFVHDDTTVLHVYKNGILQREGASNDYTHNPDTDTVTFNSTVGSGNTISIITVENTAQTVVTGLMTEGKYCDTATGLILYSKLSIANGAIAQAKVANLVTDLSECGRLIVSSTTPTGAWLATGRLWLDTSVTPNVLKFYNGTAWLATSPESSLPAFTSSDASKYVRLNGTGTGFVYDTIDLSSVIPVSQKAVANGVATLDSTGRLPAAQLTAALGAESIYKSHTGATADATYLSKRIYKQKVQITGVSIQCSAGTCNLQLAVNGVGIGSTYAVTSAGVESVLVTPQQVDASTTNQRIGYIVSAGAGLADLEVTIAISVLA